MRATASKLGLLQRCQWWARPEAEWRDTPGPAADRGRRFHVAMDQTLSSPDVVQDNAPDIAGLVANARRWLASRGIDRCSSPGDDGPLVFTEQAFAWCPVADTSNVLAGVDRDYSQGAGRLCGTADLVLVNRLANRVTVFDYKTGSGLTAGPQLRGLGLMAARAYGVTHAIVAALEVSDVGVQEVAQEELDEFALAATAGEIAELRDAIPISTPQPGSHCGEYYCPARLTCPAGANAMAALVPATEIQFSLTKPITTPEQAVWALDVLRLVSAKVDAIKDKIRAATPAEGWTLADGRQLREGHCETRGFDKTKAVALARQLGATDAQIESLQYTYSRSTGLRVTGGTRKYQKRNAA